MELCYVTKCVNFSTEPEPENLKTSAFSTLIFSVLSVRTNIIIVTTAIIDFSSILQFRGLLTDTSIRTKLERHRRKKNIK